MRFTTHIRRREWPTLFGYFLFVSVLAAGYYYNLTFVQLGLIDLGTRVVGLSRFDVSLWMAALALVAFATAIVVGVVLDRRDWSRDLYAKLRLLWVVIVVQFVLTVVAPYLWDGLSFGAWIVVCAVALGAGMPVTFSLAVDLVPVEDRGPVAAVTTAAAFFLANVYPLQWRVESFSLVMAGAMAPAVVILGVLASRRVDPVDEFVAPLAEGYEEHGVGRFCRPDAVKTWSYEFWFLVVLMFGVFFIDSLGFLRIIDTPAYIFTSWQSPELSVHLFIGAVHVVTALMAGVIYVNFDREWLFLWVFGLFGFTHLMYTMDIRLVTGSDPSLVMPMFYAAAVSFYTTLNFAIWPDLSTPDTIGRHSAIGVGLAGFFATFLSTSVALFFQSAEVPLLEHLNVVDALALLFFFLLSLTIYARRMVILARNRRADARSGEETPEATAADGGDT